MIWPFPSRGRPDEARPRPALAPEPPLVPSVEAELAAPLTMAPGTASPGTASEAPARPADRAGRAGIAAGLMLALRFVQARLVSVWGVVVAAALCPPEAFTQFAIFSTLATFVGIAVMLRIEAVFVQSPERERLGEAFRLALAAGGVTMALATLAVAIVVADGRLPGSVGLLFLLALGARAAVRLFSAEATAEGDYRAIGDANLVQAVVQPLAMILLIWLAGPDALALFAADAVGHLASAAYLLRRRAGAMAPLVARAAWSGGELLRSARHWQAAPLLLLPSTLLSFGFTVAPILALPALGASWLAALVALATRLLEVPAQMFAAVSVPLVLGSLRARPAPERQGWARRLTLLLLLAAGAMFALIAVAAAILDIPLAQTKWRGLGEVVAVLALFYGGTALVSPLHEMAALSRHPQRQVAANAAALIAAVVVILWWGELSFGMLAALGLISLARTAAHLHFIWTRLGPAAEPGERR